jgi:hypothetical protein
LLLYFFVCDVQDFFKEGRVSNELEADYLEVSGVVIVNQIAYLENLWVEVKEA